MTDANDTAATLDARVADGYRAALTPEELATAPESVVLHVVTAAAVMIETTGDGPDGRSLRDQVLLERGTVLPARVPPETVERLVRKGMVRPITVNLKGNEQ